MAFNPLKNKTQLSSAERFKTLIKVEPKKEVEDESLEVNHKSNLYKILKAKTQLEQTELIELTNLIDDYYKKYL